MKTFTVGVFPHQGARVMKFAAYTTWYNKDWPNCCEHRVWASNGANAKEGAIAQHKAFCMKKKKEVA